jgi:pyridoxamine 5'-phosphate oxidase
MERFRRWWEAGRMAAGEEADTTALATAGADGRPSVRMVILRGFDGDGFTFFTNLESPKARDLEANPLAALLFHWWDLHRQVRIEGEAHQVSREEVGRYWRTRPAGHRLAAWASPQSRPVARFDELARAYDEALHRYGGDVPIPEHWGGYRVVPEVIEFWQGREHRLHDRVRYTRADDGWSAERLAP